MQNEKFQWQSIVARYAQADTRKSIWQLVNTLVPYFVLFYLSMRSLEISFWLTLPLTILTAGFMVRIFIIFHDCGHGSFFRSKTANTWVGRVTGLLVFTPFYRWSHDHAIHHATAGDLDRRGVGDVYTMTVTEYLASPWWKRLGYRVMRHPIFMFIFGSVIVFVFTQRVPPIKKDIPGRNSVWLTNLSLAVAITAMCLLFGWKAFAIVQLLVIFFGASAGIWLFYVQHNFDGVYWDRHAQWDYFKASMQGSSFYKLPAVLNWFTGNIGYHHIHHLSAKIPNYNLPKAYKENPVFHVQPLTIPASLKSLKWRLYDEANRRLAGWDVLRKYRAMKM
jgi:omega-6 fatty acid desaturase (delta-12 desaturase)